LWEYSLGLTNGTAVCGNILSDWPMERQFVEIFSRIDQWNGSLWEYSLGLTNGTAVCENVLSDWPMERIDPYSPHRSSPYPYL
jgi:hypothetical protein